MLDDLTKAISLARDAQKFFTNAEAKLAHAELTAALADAKLEAAELQNSLMEKGRELNELREVLNLRTLLQHDGEHYWMAEREDTPEDGPFCARCFDADGKLIRLTARRYDGEVVYYCAHCALEHQRGRR